MKTNDYLNKMNEIVPDVEEITGVDEAYETNEEVKTSVKKGVGTKVGIGAAAAAMVGVGAAIGASIDNSDNDASEPAEDATQIAEAESAEPIETAETVTANSEPYIAEVSDANISDSHASAHKHTAAHEPVSNQNASDEVKEEVKVQDDLKSQHDHVEGETADIEGLEYSEPIAFRGNFAVANTDSQGVMVIDIDGDGYGDIVVNTSNDFSQAESIRIVEDEDIYIGKGENVDEVNYYQPHDDEVEVVRDLPYDDDYDCDDDDIADSF